MGGYKQESVKKKIEDAITDASSELETLKEEIRSWSDSVEEHFPGSEKSQTLSSAADEIEGLDELTADDLDEESKAIEIEFVIQTSRKPSKAVRVSNVAVAYAAVSEKLTERAEWLRERVKKPDDGDDVQALDASADACEELSGTCEEAKDALEGIEFP